MKKIKGIIPQGKPCKEVAYATYKSLRRLSACKLGLKSGGVLNPRTFGSAFPHSLGHVRASTVATSLRSSITVLLVVFCIISPKIFAGENDDNYDELDKYYFPWQLYNYYHANNSSSILLKYPFINIISPNDYDRYLKDSKDASFFDRLYAFNENLGDYIYFQFRMLKFIDDFTGGPERRRREQQEKDKIYNMLNPAEPPR
ncbi:MAG: hypothetical protein LBB89_08630 [Treponema sp.]|nr:hypothetical protein [Treponema sp.]